MANQMDSVSDFGNMMPGGVELSCGFFSILILLSQRVNRANLPSKLFLGSLSVVRPANGPSGRFSVPRPVALAEHANSVRLLYSCGPAD